MTPAKPDIKAVFFDVDGTLTSFATHTVPDSTIEALNRLRELGIRAFICTGRGRSHLKVVLQIIPFTFDGIVAMNGQYCYDDNGFLDSHPMDDADVATITAWLDHHPDAVANYCEDDTVYFNQVTETMRSSWRQLGKTAPRILVDDPHTRTASHATYQISTYISREQEAEVVSLCHNVTGVRWHPDFVDLIPADGGKPRGMRAFMRHYGITREQTMAFGDGGNDMTMLKYAGIGVAMGNANDDVKAVADYVTDDVDHAGVMHAFEHFHVI